MTNGKNSSLIQLLKATLSHSMCSMNTGWQMEKKKKSLNLYSRQSLCFLQPGKSEGQGNGLEIRATKKRGRAKRIWAAPGSGFVEQFRVAQGTHPIRGTNQLALQKASSLLSSTLCLSLSKPAPLSSKSRRISSTSPTWPSTKRRFLAASPLPCGLCNQDVPRHNAPLRAWAWRASTWNGDLEPTLKLILWLTIRRFYTVLLDAFNFFSLIIH